MINSVLSLLKTPRIITSLVLIAGTGAAFLGYHPATPLFPNTFQFVLFGSERIFLDDGVQVSSGNLGSNDSIKLEQNVLVSSNLFAKSINLKEGTTINGNATYRSLNTATSGQILGDSTSDVQLPIANLPILPAVTLGSANFTASGTATLPPGNYKDVIVTQGSTLTLASGTYNLRSFVLRGTSTLLYAGTTTLNIQWRLRGYDNVAILPADNDTQPDQLTINYWGTPGKHEKNLREDDDDDMDRESENDQERNDWHKGNAGRPILFGDNSFLNFRLIAPKASVMIGMSSTMRGQVLGRRVKISRNSTISRTAVIAKETNPAHLVTIDGETYPTNEIVLMFAPTTTFADVQSIARTVNGQVIGFIPELQIYKIEVQGTTATQLDANIATITALHNPFVLYVLKNFAGSIN